MLVLVANDQLEHPGWRGIPKYHLIDSRNEPLCQHWNLASATLIEKSEAERRGLAVCKRCES